MWPTLLDTLAHYLPGRVISNLAGDAYLARFLIFDTGPQGIRLFLHHFVRGDEDREVHNHPWKWAYSLILAGRYTEERLNGSPLDGTGDPRTVSFQTYKAGAVNVLKPNTFHRVHLPSGPAWSLILTGPIVQSWGFYDRATSVYTDAKEFLKRKGFEDTHDDGAPTFAPPRRTWSLRALFNRIQEAIR